MKRIILVFLVVFSNSIFAQTDVQSTSLQFDSQFRFEIIRPFAFGNNSLSKSHENNIGFGISLNLIEFRKFRIGGGYDFLNFIVTDFSKAGNFDKSNYNSIYGLVSYDLSLTENLSIVPYFGIGGINIRQKTNDVRNANQDGTEYKLGAFTDFDFGNSVSCYVRISYVYSKLKINTSPEYEKYFGQAHQIQFAVGIKFN